MVSLSGALLSQGQRDEFTSGRSQGTGLSWRERSRGGLGALWSAGASAGSEVQLAARLSVMEIRIILRLFRLGPWRDIPRSAPALFVRNLPLSQVSQVLDAPCVSQVALRRVECGDGSRAIFD